jgi:uncharacterized repeat protein (TIGR03803 family)
MQQTIRVFTWVKTALSVALLGTGIQAGAASTAGSEKLVHSFNGTKGQNADSALIFDTAGNLYGTTVSGGTYGLGVAYELSPNGTGGWTETVLHNFGNTKQSDGASPESGLVFDSAGNLYGTTYAGGTHGQGAVYQLVKGTSGKWSEGVIHNFGGGTDGVNPVGGLAIDPAGNLFGTTFSGGLYNLGTAFELSPSGSKFVGSVIWNFGVGTDGTNPNGGLVLDSAGNLYGLTANGGAKNYGRAFELSLGVSGWTEITQHDFGHFQDGLYPLGTLVWDSAGNLYGTTSSGGTRGYGTVFELTVGSGGWNSTIIHNFTAGNDGWQPEAEQLALDSAGSVYGTTLQGGSKGLGIVFKLSPGSGSSWTETLMHAFTGGSDGAAPVAGVVVDSGGNLYGATSGGGSNSDGIVYKITP